MINNIIGSPVALSIITGIIVFIITWPINNWLNKKTSRKEYYTRLEKANEQIINLCTDYIIMSKSLDNEVINKIIYASSTEYKVQLDEVYNLSIVKALLVKTFINLRLVQDDTKKDIIQNICKKEDSENKKDYIMKVYQNISKIDYDKRKFDLLTLTMTIIVAMGTMIAMLLSMDFEKFNLNEFNSMNSLETLTMLIMLIMAFEILLLSIMKYTKYDRKIKETLKKKLNVEKKEEDNEGNKGF